MLLLVLLLAQGSAELLVEQLASDDVEVRVEAEARLLELGSKALPALRAALRHRDSEVGIRARACLERLEVRIDLTPALIALPGLEARLLEGGAEA